MLSSNSRSCNYNHNPFSENDISSFTSKSEDPNPNNFFLGGFPNSPPHMHLEYQDDVVVYLLDHVLNSTLPIHHLDSITTAADHGNPNGTSAAENHPAAAAKKDRHSKIHTARGPRDRRMRLSLDIARKFFDLQDLLGYDKASRTVDWLLRHSSAAIRDLARGRDGLQAITDQSCTSEDYGEAAVSSSTTAAAAKSRSSGRKGKRGGGGGVQQKRATVARESRRKARDRARERTSQKRRLMRENSDATAAAAAAAAPAAAPTHNFAIYDAFQLEDLSSDEARMSGATTTEGVLCPWNSFNFHDANNEFLLQDEQIAEFQFVDKPWEAYNSFNLSG